MVVALGRAREVASSVGLRHSFPTHRERDDETDDASDRKDTIIKRRNGAGQPASDFC